MTDEIEVNGQKIPVGKLVLSPTRTYLPLIQAILKDYKSQINGMIHCTGGAQSKVKKFIKNRKVIKDNSLMNLAYWVICKQRRPKGKSHNHQIRHLLNMVHNYWSAVTITKLLEKTNEVIDKF